jgi:hypothetical protein
MEYGGDQVHIDKVGRSNRQVLCWRPPVPKNGLHQQNLIFNPSILLSSVSKHQKPPALPVFAPRR